ncbi:MAG: ATPase domain-containing protein [Candidatus Bathyarchaeia archaeon]
MAGRVRSGFEGLDGVLEGGFPRGSLILLAGEPGTGKTVFSMGFLVRGAELGEPGVYVGFAEPRDTLIENLSRHLGVDLAGLEAEGKLRILDYTALRGEGASTLLESILGEVEALKAERLAVDSFSAMAQALERPIDVRIMLQTILGRIVRGMGATTILVGEVPVGEAKMGLGVEEFVADGLIRLRSTELEGRPFRELEIHKLRGTRLHERRSVYTLEGGFKVFPPFRPKPVEKPRRFQPIRDPVDRYSTGSEDLDGMLGGGFSRGDAVLLEITEKVSMVEYHLIAVPAILNYMMHGRAVLIIPTVGVDAEKARQIGLEYGLKDEEINRLLRVCEARSLEIRGDRPYVALFDAEDPWEDYSKYVGIEEELMRMTGQPVMHVAGLDTLASYYGESMCGKILGQDAARIRRHGSLGIILLKPGYKRLARRLAGIATVHLKLLREHGCLLLYGVKPRTILYGVEMDTSKGYPMPRLTPIT